MDGFIEGNGFVMIKCEHKPPLIEMTKMKTADGKRRFPFLPDEEELSAMSEKQLYKIPLESAQVMLDNQAMSCHNSSI